MTEQVLKDRIEFLKSKRLDIESQYNAITGAIQEAEYWLSLMAKKEEKQA